jgi:RNase P/RNase MRP subunit p30
MEEQKNKDVLNQPLVVINIGLKGFAEALENQGVDVLQIDWVPPAGGDHELMDILDKLL